MIGYYVHHQGSGHLARLTNLARHLRSPVTALSSLDAPSDWRGEWVPLARDDDPPPGSDADIDAHGRLHWAPLRHGGYTARMATISAWITTHRPRLMVVDVSVEVTLLARTLGVPVVVVAMRGERADPAHELAYDVAQALLAPWPAEFAEPHWPERWIAKTVHTGAFSRFDAPRVGPAPAAAATQRSVTCLLGGGGADLPARFAPSVAAATPDWRWTFCGGDFGPSATPLRDVLAASQVVVTHAGQNAVAEVAALRRPAVVVAQPRPHDEQLATVRALAAGDVAVTCERWPAANDWPALLARAVATGGTSWSRWNDLQGARRAADALDGLGSR
ncbi:glycosyltransferase [Allobranchiibius huperziae]|uniref:Glycosyl transferase family 28 C-terminal domain-containing protein n=1 Tax=Allobranchiibius huperziae TaxID=1874116 RepID=A0A853DKG6_9MICO|nr:glycosyltransferase [Allobranchiibius huperziae]NYJ76429.1 hypothetical protein [Allobranchiibius huperziae]